MNGEREQADVPHEPSVYREREIPPEEWRRAHGVPEDCPRPSSTLDRPDSPGRDASAATARRLEREEAFARTATVAGHDFKREHAERERGR